MDGEVGTSGQVRFTQVTPNRTRVEVQMNYADPPGGKLGRVGPVGGQRVAHKVDQVVVITMVVLHHVTLVVDTSNTIVLSTSNVLKTISQQR